MMPNLYQTISFYNGTDSQAIKPVNNLMEEKNQLYFNHKNR